MFVKGQSGNPAGRPKGAKDKRWATLEYWVEKLEEELPRLDKGDRAEIILEMFKIIAGRRPLPSLSPEDSVENVKTMLEELSKAEEKAA